MIFDAYRAIDLESYSCIFNTFNFEEIKREFNRAQSSLIFEVQRVVKG